MLALVGVLLVSHFIGSLVILTTMGRQEAFVMVGAFAAVSRMTA